MGDCQLLERRIFNGMVFLEYYKTAYERTCSFITNWLKYIHVLVVLCGRKYTFYNHCRTYINSKIL